MDRSTDRHTDRERHRERERERQRDENRQTDGQTDRQTDRERQTETDRQRQTDKTDRQTVRQTDRQRQTDRDRQTDSQTDRQRETDRQTDRSIGDRPFRFTSSACHRRHPYVSCCASGISIERSFAWVVCKAKWGALCWVALRLGMRAGRPHVGDHQMLGGLVVRALPVQPRAPGQTGWDRRSFRCWDRSCVPQALRCTPAMNAIPSILRTHHVPRLASKEVNLILQGLKTNPSASSECFRHIFTFSLR